MQKLVKDYLNELNRRQRRRRRTGIALALLVVIVFGSVVGILTQYGIAMTEDAKCGIEEHVHNDGCYQDVLACGREESDGHQHGEACYQTEDVLVCGQEEREGHAHGEECYAEDGTLVCGQEESEGHVHGDACHESKSTLVCGQEESEGHHHEDACHERQLACGKEEHTHTEECRIDPNADVEDASRWDAQYAGVQWSGNWGEDLVTAARKQLGYKESMNNYRIAENKSHKGYTRYGQFIGDVYADWDAAFVNFCLHYAGLMNTGMFVSENDSARWHERTANGANGGYLTGADGYGPRAGDIVFFHRDNEETGTQMGIVSSYDNGSNEIKVIEGNSGSEVKENKYAANDGRIFAYLKVTEMEKAYKHIDENMAGAEGTEPSANVDESGEPQTGGVNPGTENAGDADGENGNPDATEPGTDENAGSGDETENPENDVEAGESDEVGKSENGKSEIGEDDPEAEGDNADAEEEEITAAVVEELEKSPAYEASYKDDMGTIHVAAGEGAIPEGAELSVKKIEPVMTTADLDDEEAVVAKEINDQYELTAKKLQEESEKNNTTLEGFLAYDISFQVDGVEVEPNGPVKVTMHFDEAVKPEAVSENATVAVNHLKEDATAEDGVVVEDLTEKEATTITTTAEEDVAVEKVELVTGSFSTFAISWALPGMPYGTPIKVIHVNSQGELIFKHPEVDDTTLDMYTLESNKKYRVRDFLKLEPVSVENITYVPDEIKICTILDWESKTVEDCGSAEFVSVNESFYLNFYASEDGEISYSCYIGEVYNQKCLKVVYQPTNISIDDKIMENGNLQPLLGEDLIAQYEEAADKGEAEFVWYKKINGGEERRVSNNGRNNIAEYGTWLNVALDDGALNASQTSVEYRVELRIKGEKIADSGLFSIVYYNELQNGSFEEPVVTDSSSWADFSQEQVVGWKTTARNYKTSNGSYDIEIARIFKPVLTDGTVAQYYTIADLYQNRYTERDFLAADGFQFAELNAESQGSLYQDVLTAKGTRLNYHLAHRARCIGGNAGNTDDMYLLIVPTVVAKSGINKDGNEIDTQDEVKALIARRNERDEKGELRYPGVYVQKYTATTNRWTEHDGTYTPQYDLNRFFFVSDKVDPTMGNFLDDVWFSQNLPAPKENTFSFRINKKIMGIDTIGENDAERQEYLKANIIKDLRFTITVTDKFTNERVTINGIPASLDATDAKMEWSYNISEGSWVGIARFDNIEIPNGAEYTISVTEQNADIGDYRRDTSVMVVGSKMETLSEADTSTTGVTGSVDVSKDVNRGLRFTNVYSQNISYDWEVVKYSSTDATNLLAGAEFELKQGDKVVATGVSRDATVQGDGSHTRKGVVDWTWVVNAETLNGDYILSETKAPDGFVSTTESLTLTFKDGELQPITSNSSYITVNLDSDTNKYTILVKNDVEPYELPSTGGAGIYLYMFGGVLLMAAAALITYRNKRREVLRS